ncbi:MarR family transcriptional regulator [Paenibacillus larvae]|uniref:Transcriptional regulator-like protein n=6 Tax=Paenibacillus larvae TaxID=1464 RepID=A0A2L1UIR5_9BACL|nr:MarR family transcriptional regulator [Paenibacillus larvae]AQR78343.1 transcriptional regulator [Paenibacillus larvae subsp. larvae]AQT84594.1 transcriptional regulator [Paenibacillus larvae subsp. pulvifaciens]AQZ46593.1 transcriptional regulator [Paenibacillus larvae subsp. pulvifaciens]ARF68002.1 transcriptional regulator [Paenibacillus larvae subsp. pulvifaciens]AVF20437.1 transcriptional regulator-like protein [Paenibacillus larvae subsp. larvae]
MLNDLFEDFYMKLTMSFYKNASQNQTVDIENISAVEMSCLEVVYFLKNPTYSELAEFLNISQPNATYRINKLIKKGYLEKFNDKKDKRVYYLQVTDKFMKYYCLNDNYINNVIANLKKRCTADELQQFEKMLKILTKEVME